MSNQTEPLYSSCYGHVRACAHSGRFWLDFGEMQVWLCHERLRQLARKVNQLVKVLEQPQRPVVVSRLLLCPPGSDGDVFAFSGDELLDLQLLVNGSLVMAELDGFLCDRQFLLEN